MSSPSRRSPFGPGTSLSREWRSLPTARLAWISSAAGAATQLLHLAGLALLPGDVLIPGTPGTLAVALKLLLPGILVGLATPAAIRLVRPRVVS